MTVFRATLSETRRPARLAAFAVVCAALCISTAQAQIEDAALAQAATPVPPYALFEYSTLTGSGDTITATWVPVVTSTGATVYKDITLLFTVDSAGNLSLASGYPKVITSPANLVASFRAGKYVGPSTIASGGAIVNVSGPGITLGGATEWSLAAPTGANYYTYPASATWYVRSVASSPLAARLKAAGITGTTLTAWSFGFGGTIYGGNGAHWYPGSLLGFSQTGNTLTIVSFSTDNGYSNAKDSPLPIDQITYTLAP